MSFITRIRIGLLSVFVGCVAACARQPEALPTLASLDAAAVPSESVTIASVELTRATLPPTWTATFTFTPEATRTSTPTPTPTATFTPTASPFYTTTPTPRPTLEYGSNVIAFVRHTRGIRGVTKVAFDIFLLDLDSGKEFNLSMLPTTSGYSKPRWTPDGTKVMFRGATNHFLQVSADGQYPASIIWSDITGVEDFDWSPDGRMVVYSQFGNRFSDLRLVGPDGQNPFWLTNSRNVSEYGVRWSPDGTRLLYMEDTPESLASKIPFIVVVDATCAQEPEGCAGGNRIGSGRDAVWSPDGTQIAFVKPPGGPQYKYNQLFVMNADGSNIRQLTPSGLMSVASPTWSPDGTQLAFTGVPSGDAQSFVVEGDAQIFVVNVDGSNLRQLTFDDNASSFDPVWRPR